MSRDGNVGREDGQSGSMGVDIGAWLRDLGLGQYERAFRDNDVDAGLLPTLTTDELRELGVASLGHRKRFLAAIAALGGGPGVLPPHAPPAMPPGEAERRQLTVMFVDLVGSTALSARLDPEEMGDVLRVYQNAVAGEVARFEGHIAKFMGDGVLAYFGWPRAHEDEAERAVRAGLALVAAVAALRPPTGDPLAARVGIATGLVMVGELTGEGEARERSVVGDTPNLAARLQTLAPANGVVVALATRRLLGALFDLDELEPRPIKGLAEPVAGFAVLGERAATSRFEARGGQAALPMAGRDQELALLLERWALAKAGEGQGVLLVGEAGIGKSRITRALLDAVAIEPHLRIRLQCSPYHTDSALWPVIEHLRHAAGLTAEDLPDVQLDRLEALLRQSSTDVTGSVPLFAELLGVDTAGRYEPLDVSSQLRRARTLLALADALVAAAVLQPALVVIEDAHWLDPSTLELVELYLDRTAAARVLILLTSRPDRQPAVAAHPHVTRLTLNRLGRAGAEAIVASLSGGRTLPPEITDAIIARTDGVPLFVEEMTKAVLETGAAGELKIPASLHDSLMARLDRFPEVKEIAQIAACIGRVFDYPLLAAVAGRSEAELAAALDKLTASELVFRRGVAPEASYTFKHALVQDAAYESLLRSRRQALHRQIAEALAERFPERAAAEPNLLAHHYTAAGLADQAASSWHRAAEQAFARSANQEAIGHLTRSLAQLALLPETPGRAARELAMQRLLGTAAMTVKGYGAAEVMRAFGRAWELSSLVDEDQDGGIFAVLWGIWLFRLTRAEHSEAAETAADLLARARRVGNAGGCIAGHLATGTSALHLGRPQLANGHLAESKVLYEAQEHPDLSFRYGFELGVTAYAYLGWCTAVLGRPDRARGLAEQGLVTLERNRHLHYTYARGSYWLSVVHQLLGDWPMVRDLAGRAIASAEEQNYSMVVAVGRIMHGAATAALGAADGIDELRHGLEAYHATGARFQRTYYLALLAAAATALGRTEEGRAALDEAMALAAETGERLCEPELHRLRGVLLLREGQTAPAETALLRAIEMARRQAARWWELRAARDLARLWAGLGERRKARDLLAPVYGWFTEGLDTPDLRETKALLAEFG